MVLVHCGIRDRNEQVIRVSEGLCRWTSRWAVPRQVYKPGEGSLSKRRLLYMLGRREVVCKEFRTGPLIGERVRKVKRG